MIKFELLSIVNFWILVFRFLSNCIKEVEKICVVFLWTGFRFKLTGVKIAWDEFCNVKSEGGLGIRKLKEVNKVYGLKLIWRMFFGDFLWGKWIRVNFLKGKSFWEVKFNV